MWVLRNRTHNGTDAAAASETQHGQDLEVRSIPHSFAVVAILLRCTTALLPTCKRTTRPLLPPTFSRAFGFLHERAGGGGHAARQPVASLAQALLFLLSVLKLRRSPHAISGVAHGWRKLTGGDGRLRRVRWRGGAGTQPVDDVLPLFLSAPFAGLPRQVAPHAPSPPPRPRSPPLLRSAVPAKRLTGGSSRECIKK